VEALQRSLAAGRDAIRRYAWAEAFELLLSAADEVGDDPDPEVLDELGEASWWVARLDVGIPARERAYRAYLEADNPRRAAIVAIAVAKDHFALGRSSIGMAWFSRAEELLSKEPECLEEGYLERMRAVMAVEGTKQFDEALEHARRAEELARRFGDRDLLALGIQDQGRALVAKGEVDEGWKLLDEATVAAVSGELSPYVTGVIYCNTITVCKHVADWRRAGEWSEAAKRWCERQAIAGFPGMCRVYRAGVMLMRGDWSAAEREARAACDELGGFNVGYAAEAFYELGEVKLHIGDLRAAEQAFSRAHELGRDPQPGLARLRLAEGNLKAAATCIAGALSEAEAELERAVLLPTRVEIVVAAGDLDAATEATEELEAIAATFGTIALRASAHTARGHLALAKKDATIALEHLRRARRLWQEVDAPYEAASVRLLLARAYLESEDEDSAVLEARSAVAAFDRLGAVAAFREALDLAGEVPARDSLGRDRARKTFMFTDIVKSTKLVEAIGDDAWHDLVRWHDDALRRLFATHGGEEVDHAGDGFFVAFDSVTLAIDCAATIQRMLAEHRRTQGFAPQVRLGLHAADSTRRGSEYRGRGVHEAARIAAVAEGGEILVSRAAVDGENVRFSLSEPRAVTLTGISDPVEVVSVDWR
jgi:class 3 adenylate cyclase